MGRLPAEFTSFIGRNAELHEILRLFHQSRLITLAGPGGVGKTRLAIQAVAQTAENYADGICFIDLGALHEADLIATTVCESLGLSAQNVGAPGTILVEYLSTRHLLLILDTCEHLVDACADLTEHLLRAAPRLTILTTTRIPLNIPGEHVLGIGPLTCEPPAAADEPELSEAARLFADRATAVAHDWRLTTTNLQPVHRLCERLDGIPLALELAAAHVRTLSAEQILARLDHRILEVPSRRGRRGRHQTLDATIGWSFELCSPQEKLLWARLSALTGDFDLDIVEHVCADGQLPLHDVVATLSSLVDQSIVLRTGSQDDARFRLLDTVREFGARELERRGERDTLRSRIADWLVENAEQARRDLSTGAQVGWLDWYAREQHQIREACDHLLRGGRHEEVFLTVARLIAMHGLIGEARYWAGRAFPDTTASGEGLTMRALFIVMHDEADAARPLLDRAAALAESTGDEPLKGYIALVDGIAGLFAGQLAEARTRLEEGRAIHAGLETRDVLVPLGPVFIAVVAALQGDFDGAVEQTAAVVAAGAEAGELWARSYAEAVWGMTLMLSGEPSAGLLRLREALRVKHDLDDMLGIALALEFYGGCLLNLGTPEAAARLIGSVEDARTVSGISMFGPQHTLIREIMEQQCRDALGEEVFDAQRRIGHQIGLERTLAGILAESDPPAPAQSVPEPLTKREYEIARLVSQGLTNRQIAERLGIAKRTVDTHMENILTKLAISSRVQIGAWIQRNAP